MVNGVCVIVLGILHGVCAGVINGFMLSPLRYRVGPSGTSRVVCGLLTRSGPYVVTECNDARLTTVVGCLNMSSGDRSI